ncbi:MAG: PfkB family carbohydrate kinase [Anaerolineae bacterium]|nr:PfkB family carbohydrate kinase [Anaerolineae bacterium]MDW8070856.1 PfkB family carbohydrate kinase [Anaerolineae bacterium]
MSDRWDVLGLGVAAVDDLFYVERFPRPNTKTPIQAQERQGGGLTGTALVAAARLGVRAAYLGILGDDPLSRFALESLESEGVDCTPVLRHPDARPVYAVVIVDRSSGERTIFYTTAGYMPVPSERIEAQLIQRCRVLFVDYTAGEGGLYATMLAHRFGIPVVADIEREQAPAVAELISQVDHLIVDVEIAARLSGETQPPSMVRALARRERACCVVTAGEKGCWYAEWGGEVHHFPAYRVEVVDTTGCGDVFHGAYAACIARGEPVARAIQVASATAALKATQPGGRSGIPTWSVVEAFLNTAAHVP